MFGSRPKELNYFGRPKACDPELFEEYLSNFPHRDGARYYFESSPHYFRPPDPNRPDPGRNILEMLGDPRVLVICRNPVDRYESAYRHHMTKRGWDVPEAITMFDNCRGMLDLGRYGESLEHWLGMFPSMKVVLYDDLCADPVRFVDEIMVDFLGLSPEFTPDVLQFRTNDSKVKADKKGIERLPSLSDGLRQRLIEYYSPDVDRFERLSGLDASRWRQAWETGC